MAKYKVLIYGPAKQDLADIVEYINTLSPDAALKQYERIVEKIAGLQEMPERCPLCKDMQLRIKGYRMLVADNYLVFYIVRNHEVQIRRILYGMRKHEWLIE